MPNFSTAEENYIKAVYHLQQHGVVSTNALANHLNTAAASATDMLKKLHTKKILHYKPYRGVTLNKEGIRIALYIIRKHRLWEYFLVEVLEFSWDEVHDVAEQLEHINSTKLINSLDAFLKHPRFDPHGDPIPDIDGKMEMPVALSLSELPVNTPAILSAVTVQSTEMLEFLRLQKISIGARIEIKKRQSIDRSVEIKVRNKNNLNLSKQLAEAL